MANATHFPTAAQLALFQWANPTYPRPQLRTGVTATLSATTLNWTAPPLDKDGAIITAPFLAYIRKTTGPKRGLVALAYCPNGANGTSGLSSTGCILGIRPSGFDYTTGDADFLVDLDAGDEIGCADASVIAELLRQALQGGAATGANGLIIGADNAAATVTIYRSTTPGVSLGWIRWYLGSNKVEFSDDGVTWNAISDVAASVLFKVSSDDTTAGYAEDKIVDDNSTIAITVLNPGGNEQLQIATNYSATKTEIDQALDGIGASVTAANLTDVTDKKNADALHIHNFTLFFGDGSDGDVTISSPTTLTRDMYYNNLTVNSTLNTGGFRIYCKTSLTGTGTIQNNGGNGGTASGQTGGAAGVAAPGLTVSPGQAGVVGAAAQNAGTSGGTASKVMGVFGSNGGATTGLGAPRAGGTPGIIIGTRYNRLKTFLEIYNLFDVLPSFTLLGVSAGGGGGAGSAGAGTATGFAGGGGSGASGGVVWVSVPEITGTLTFRAKGGTGGDGAGGGGILYGGGGGAGGSGGIVILFYKSKTGETIDVSGGAGGAGGVGSINSGSAGNTGLTSNSYLIPLA